MPILDIGLQHMLGQMGANATRAENVSIAEAKGQPPPEVSKFTLAHQKDAPAECGPGQPCTDASCCNSEGKCGFKPYNCVSSTATTCISNCDAHAMCGVDSLRGQQKCKLNLCCSYFGYCGTTDAHCTTQGQTPCQPGFGDCQVMSAPTCTTKTASRGRRVAYYQGGNVANRACDQVYPSQINTIGLTHLNFAFASIDPVTFCVTAADPRDFLLYHQFTSLSSPHRLQTWISIGGGGFSGPGPTHTTWSDLSSSASNRAAFISSLVDFMHKWGFQGADLDWEFPAQPDSGGKPEDTANLALLLKEMSAAFGTKYGISLALPTDFNYLAAFDPIALQPYVSFFNFMAYDLHGPWEAARLGALLRPQAALPDIESTLLPIWFDGIDANKLNLGLPYYGRGATVSSTSCVDLNCPYSSLSRPGQCSGEAGVLSLKEIQEIIAQRHLTPKVLPGIFQKSITFDDQWISYDDSDTVAEKTQWADQHCFGGTMIWSIDLANGNGRPTVSVDGSCGNVPTTAQYRRAVMLQVASVVTI
ncbi:Chitotriosidase-1 [Lachnellula cervina]|uniref:chitinase n=1 Tax=Lachnellula cervina TaxID=1316786 RepID=A0A7D8UUP2_9HELO|nr:Chitotriosidase-1 [Lachnellula cervina]